MHFSIFLLWLYLHQSMIVFNHIPINTYSSYSLIDWIAGLASYYNVEIKRLQYNFVEESTLLQINQDHLKHDTHTDIITFSYASTSTIEAEIFISTDRMRENASLHGETLENEMIRLLSHGFLHAIGFKDSNSEEKSQMTIEENRCINMFHVKQEKHV